MRLLEVLRLLEVPGDLSTSPLSEVRMEMLGLQNR